MGMVGILQIDLQTNELVPTKSLLCFREHNPSPASSILATVTRPSSIQCSRARQAYKFSNLIRFFYIQRHMELLKTSKPYFHNIWDCHLWLFLISCRENKGADTSMTSLMELDMLEFTIVMFSVKNILHFWIYNILNNSYYYNIYYKCQK